MTELIQNLIHTYLDPRDLLAYLLFLMSVDILAGLIASARLRRISSSVAWKGITRKGATCAAVLFLLAIEPFVKAQLGRDLGVSWLITMGFVGVEALSIIENLGRSGIALPTELRGVFEKLAQNVGQPIAEEKPKRAPRRRKAQAES